MITRPDKLPRFATVDTTDPETGKNNVIEPSETRKDTGWHPKNSFSIRQYTNWIARKTYQWLKMFDDMGGEFAGCGTIPLTSAMVPFGADTFSTQSTPTLGWTMSNGTLNLFIRGLVITRSTAPLVFIDITGTSLATHLNTVNTKYIYTSKFPLCGPCCATHRRSSQSDPEPVPISGTCEIDLGLGLWDLTHPNAIRFNIGTTITTSEEVYLSLHGTIPMYAGSKEELDAIYFP